MIEPSRFDVPAPAESGNGNLATCRKAIPEILRAEFSTF